MNKDKVMRMFMEASTAHRLTSLKNTSKRDRSRMNIDITTAPVHRRNNLRRAGVALLMQCISSYAIIL